MCSHQENQPISLFLHYYLKWDVQTDSFDVKNELELLKSGNALATNVW